MLAAVLEEEVNASSAPLPEGPTFPTDGTTRPGLWDRGGACPACPR